MTSFCCNADDFKLPSIEIAPMRPDNFSNFPPISTRSPHYCLSSPDLSNAEELTSVRKSLAWLLENNVGTCPQMPSILPAISPSFFTGFSRSSGLASPRQRGLKPSRYKSELCRQFEETGGQCRYGEKCQFAHGLSELRSFGKHPRYKTELCRSFHSTGFCAYGSRCDFIHGENALKLVQISLLQQQLATQAAAQYALQARLVAQAAVQQFLAAQQQELAAFQQQTIGRCRSTSTGSTISCSSSIEGENLLFSSSLENENRSPSPHGSMCSEDSGISYCSLPGPRDITKL